MTEYLAQLPFSFPAVIYHTKVTNHESLELASSHNDEAYTPHSTRVYSVCCFRKSPLQQTTIVIAIELVAFLSPHWWCTCRCACTTLYTCFALRNCTSSLSFPFPFFPIPACSIGSRHVIARITRVRDVLTPRWWLHHKIWIHWSPVRAYLGKIERFQISPNPTALIRSGISLKT